MDISLSDYGRKETEIEEIDMPGCTHIAWSLHMTIQTAVLIENLKALSSDLHWCSCKIFSTQDYAVAAIVRDESAAVFSWKGESLE